MFGVFPVKLSCWTGYARRQSTPSMVRLYLGPGSTPTDRLPLLNFSISNSPHNANFACAPPLAAGRIVTTNRTMTQEWKPHENR